MHYFDFIFKGLITGWLNTTAHLGSWIFYRQYWVSVILDITGFNDLVTSDIFLIWEIEYLSASRLLFYEIWLFTCIDPCFYFLTDWLPDLKFDFSSSLKLFYLQLIRHSIIPYLLDWFLILTLHVILFWNIWTLLALLLWTFLSFLKLTCIYELFLSTFHLNYSELTEKYFVWIISYLLFWFEWIFLTFVKILYSKLFKMISLIFNLSYDF